MKNAREKSRLWLSIAIMTLALTLSASQLSLAYDCIKDCVCVSCEPNSNHNNDALTVGLADGCYFVSLAQFDINGIPSGAVIEEARLSLYCILEQDIGKVKIMELDESWSERGVTWNNMPYGNGNGASSYMSNISTGWNNADVTEQVRAWHSGLRSNYGFQVKPQSFTEGQFAMFYDREAGGYGPRLTVSYSTLPDPPNVSARPGSNPGNIHLSWNSVNGATGYVVVYDEDSNNPPWSPANDGNPSSGSDIGNRTSLNISSLTPSQNYHLAVAAYNSSGLGEYSDIVTSYVEDNYEHNDSRQYAYNISSNERTWLTGIEGFGIQADEDWFKIYVSEGFLRVKIDCQFKHSDGDIDIALYNSSGARLCRSYSASDDEYIDCSVGSSGSYYIKVYYGDAGNRYDLWWDDIIEDDVAEIDYPELPEHFSISQNFPNPFNSSTQIEFALPRTSFVRLEIFNILGEKVRTLVDEELTAGHKMVQWEGTDDNGKGISSGIYFFRIATGDFAEIRKMLLLK